MEQPHLSKLEIASEVKSKKLILHSVCRKLDELDLATHGDASMIVVTLLPSQAGPRQQRGQLDARLSQCCTSTPSYCTRCARNDAEPLETRNGHDLSPEVLIRGDQDA